METTKKILIVYSYPLTILLSGILPGLSGLLYGYHAGLGLPFMAGSFVWVLVFTFQKFLRTVGTSPKSSRKLGLLLLITYFPVAYFISLLIEMCVTPGEISSVTVRRLLMFPVSLLFEVISR
jgi:uncharacterized membrane protein YfhO